MKKDNNEEMCECGHNTIEHSYNPQELGGGCDLECDICDCKQFTPKKSQNHKPSITGAQKNVGSSQEGENHSQQKVVGKTNDTPRQNTSSKVNSVTADDIQEAIKEIRETLEEGIVRNKVLPLDWAMDRIEPIVEKALSLQKEEFKEMIKELRNSLFEIGKWGKQHGNGELIPRGVILKEIDELLSRLEEEK